MQTILKIPLSEGIKMYDAGKTLREIAKEMGVVKTTVRRMFEKLAVPVRNNSESKTGRRIKPFTSEHKANLSKSIFKGNEVGVTAGNCRAWRMYEAKICSHCGSTDTNNKNMCRHHIDGNTLNNALENIQILCRSCHHREHVCLRKEKIQ